MHYCIFHGCSGLLHAVAAACPLAPRLPYLFVDAREAAAVVQVQRLLRSLVGRHQRYQKEIQRFRSICKHAAAAVASGASAPLQSTALTEELAAAEQTTAKANDPQAADLSRAMFRQRKPLRVLIVGAPNVGKSKIANCLLGRKVARSYRWPGVTRSVNVRRWCCWRAATS